MRLEPQINHLSTDEELSAESGLSTTDPQLSSISSNVKHSGIATVGTVAFNGQNSGHSSGAQHSHHGPIKMSLKVSNITTAQQNTDTLYQTSKSGSCNTRVCLGSVMAQPTSASNPKNNEEVLDEAVELLEQYFIHLKKPSSSEFSQRLSVIATEIERTGTYTLSTDELHFAAKTAWRNASRCIGRIQWNKLELQDARHVSTTAEMFDYLCKHIQLATNDGNLRSFITVFPQRVVGRDDFRIWNSQLISYAGYSQSDGSIIGDPGRVEFTRICQRLGWKGRNGRFDVLPLVLSAPKEGIKCYEIPEEIILRVKIEHPIYESLKELDLEWYALPAVSEMMFDCGGLQFTACPFNGWYMGTEIGARDFCDPQRYNLTEKIAKLLSLDVSNASTLWRDKAVVEINVAVLHSYQKAGITIVDHHSASESFMKHMQTEYRQRGGCPADWVWIVPPISASITPVFHQEMLNYTLKPSFEYQEKGWKSHKWIDSSVKLRFSFTAISKATLWALRLMSIVMLRRMKVSILYASETGKSEAFAQKLSKLMQNSFNVGMVCLEDYNIDDLSTETMVVFVTSTFGNGEAPDNGKEFWKSICKSNQQNSSLKHLKYAVFALGSSQYPSFCAFGIKLDKTLQALGATPVLPIGMGDEMRGQEQTFNSWGPECYKSLCKEFDMNIENKDISLTSFDEKPYDQQRVRITEVFTECNEQQIHHELARIHRKKVISCKIITRVRLQPKQSERQTLLVRLCPSNAVAKNALIYEPGDHLAIFPSNPKEVVNALLGHLNNNGYNDADSPIQVEHSMEGKWIADTRLPSSSLRVALTRYLDITTPPNQRFLSYMISMANDNWDSYRLTKLSNDIDDYEKWRSYNNPTIADVLNQFPSVHVSPEFLLTQLPLLQARYYSISSSQKVTPDEVHLTMDVLSYQIHDGLGPKRLGVCSSFIDRFPETDIPCYLRSAPAFKLPDNKKLPVIMIGTGSGIAPFRGFWLERQTDLQNGEICGKMFLFFGCRNSTDDNIYSSDLTSLMRKGVIHDTFTAYSRDKGHKRQYVQDQIIKQRALIYWLIERERAHIYVCGHTLMADGVKKSFFKLFESEGKLNESQSQQLFTNLVDEGRYHEDVFGLLHR